MVVGGAVVVSSLSSMIMEARLGDPVPTITSDVGVRRDTENRSFPSMSLSSTVLIDMQSVVVEGWKVKPTPEMSP